MDGERKSDKERGKEKVIRKGEKIREWNKISDRKEKGSGKGKCRKGK